MQSFQVADLTVILTRKSIKNLILRVKLPQGEVNVSAPKFASEQVIYQFIFSRLDWIRAKQAALQQHSQAIENAEQQADYGEIWGQRYPLHIVTGAKSNQVLLQEGQVWVYQKYPDKDRLVSQLEGYYRAILQKELARLIPKWQSIIGVVVSEWRIKKMKTRWGSCNTSKARVWFNLELVKRPPECLEYVVVHELVHLLEPSHNHRFKALLDQFYPNWRDVQRRMG